MENVAVNATMSLARVLKPPTNFEDAYQGLNSTNVPIAIPGTLDFRAGTRGFDPQLLAGVSIPLGSRLLLWIPQSFADVGEGFPGDAYDYRILWRLRSQADAQLADQQQLGPENPQRGIVGHLQQQYAGIPADNGMAPNDPTQERVVIPAALTSVAYGQTEPGGDSTDGVTHLRGERLSVRGEGYGPNPQQAPLVNNNPGLLGVVGQGTQPFPLANLGRLSGPIYLPFETDAFGDEYLILVTRGTLGASTWDFTGADRHFSSIFGTDGGTRAPVAGVGIYAMTGSGST